MPVMAAWLTACVGLDIMDNVAGLSCVVEMEPLMA